MAGGVIHVNSGKGDVLFLSPEGKEVLSPSKNVTVKLSEDFAGMTISEALMEAKKFAVGALQQRVAEKMRGFKCQPVVRNVDVKYTIKYGFQGQKPPRSH